ncbi:MAG: YkgJ family cysteine cluster protein [Okeania sp. SIO3I5]|uniref:YkgJ family cysteine cluster protein n=1 Tax=Okeania sp. SIO3I5 TaxID=2607805 RepID=UPI0013BA3654|nr:YkgJ family cysteine cluster protein [Okeania sp. SIO3I5]NEQ36650.1 YkgJ family cysteine cluster protein [Okeania sp. SIO3I5]
MRTNLQQEKFPVIGRKTIIKEVPSGEIRMEDGADGAWILFDCDCLDALFYCRAQCCALRGTLVMPEEEAHVNYDAYFDQNLGLKVLRRDADGFCYALNRQTKTCSIYDIRSQTCRDFHCTRGVNMRGFKLSNKVHRQSNY